MNDDGIGTERVSVDDRLTAMLLLAGLFHLIVILGISFSASGGTTDRAPPTLEVLLVSDTLPESTRNRDARYLSQRSQQGAGNLRDDGRTQMPANANGPLDQAGDADSQPSPQSDGSATGGDQQVIVSPSDPFRARLSPQDEGPRAREDGAQQQLLAGLPTHLPSVEDDPELRLKGSSQRELLVTPSTRQSDVAVYLDAWRRKVERVGTLNFPNQARRRHMSGNPVVEVVLGSGGQLLDAIVRRSSGYAELDQAAIGILRLAAPFEPFGRELAERHDALRFAYEWQFVGGQLTGSSVQMPAGPR